MVNDDKAFEDLIIPIVTLMEECNNEVVDAIIDRLEAFGVDGLRATDIHRLVRLAHTEGLAEIKKIISIKTQKSLNEVDSLFTECAKLNDEMATYLFAYRGIEQSIYTSAQMRAIIHEAEEVTKYKLLNLSKTFAFKVDGEYTPLSEAYIKTINRSAYMVQSGYTNYYSAMRENIKQLAGNGIHVVDWESGYHRRLDSSVRMNLLDAVRDMNAEYRQAQGEKFGADGVEISLHYDCAPDHLDLQGRQFGKEEFEQMQARFRANIGAHNSKIRKIRPIGELNCRHSIFPIILGVSEPVHDDKTIEEAKKHSQERVSYTDSNGVKHEMTRYEATQWQRKQETELRRMKEQKQKLEEVGDTLGAQDMGKTIRAKSKAYRQASAEMGLRPDMKRARIVKK